MVRWKFTTPRDRINEKREKYNKRAVINRSAGYRRMGYACSDYGQTYP